MSSFNSFHLHSRGGRNTSLIRSQRRVGALGKASGSHKSQTLQPKPWTQSFRFSSSAPFRRRRRPLWLLGSCGKGSGMVRP